MVDAGIYQTTCALNKPQDMLAKAEALKLSCGAAAANTSFVESPITDVNLPPGIADCIISNCVVNLVPDADKPRVFRAMVRLLKPGGRVALSDILARRPLPDSIRNSMALYVGCIAGASLVEQYKDWLEAAGFSGKVLARRLWRLNSD